ncbi:hypothetical protein EPA93_17480 [Ktedonosporobacter rubrisoli]|uniref:Uncharacterized protein n=1 Tax=Ktedonosporobacter rubrisoli TaxID=2509675 RepID=A0A4P6JQV1_KTERU|nr:hypothetical protein [Ktedonosporobacter rubrisoli]QBD77684.1 hypothetical protein EPA93_17480 [Ktedonosporobacter rubrisoli]
MSTSGDILRAQFAQDVKRTPQEYWEIEGLNDEDIAAELLDERVELSTVVPLWDCNCDADCGRNYR